LRGPLAEPDPVAWLPCLRVRHFATVVELIEALREFKRRYNEQGWFERHGYRSPAQVRRDLTAPIPAVA
jgi:hypothetical protein